MVALDDVGGVDDSTYRFSILEVSAEIVPLVAPKARRIKRFHPLPRLLGINWRTVSMSYSTQDVSSDAFAPDYFHTLKDLFLFRSYSS